MTMIRGSTKIVGDSLKIIWDRHYAGKCIPNCLACHAIKVVEELSHDKEYEALFNQRSNMILGIEPKVKIPKPIGARVIAVPVQTTLTIEERAKKAGLVAVVEERSKPRQTLSIVVKLSIDPFIEENFKVGMGVYHGPLSGKEIGLEGKWFRSFGFEDIEATLEEEEVPEDYKKQVRHFLLSPAVHDEV